MTTTAHATRLAPARHHRHHPIREWGNARFFDSMDWYLHRRLGDRKRRLFAALPHDVVELGSGGGASMRYLLAGSRLVAIEPNVHTHDALQRRADRYGIDLVIRAEGAESTGLATGSVDAVLSTLVLCTVDDPMAALAEVRRILRPGGRLVFIEHVGAASGPLRALQRLLFRPWRFVFDGCCLDRDMATMIRNAGFADVQIDRFRLGGLFVPVWPQISGVAIA